MVGDLDLLLQYRDAPRKIVMLPDFPGQLFKLGLGYGLLHVQFGLHLPGGPVAGDDYPQQRQAAGDESHDDCFHSVISFLLWGGLVDLILCQFFISICLLH